MKILIAVAPEKFRDEELAEPIAAFQKAGIEFDIASTRRGSCTGMMGAKTTATLSFDDVDPKQYEGLVIVGGAGSQTHLWGDEMLIPIVNIFHQRGKVLAAICLAPVVLARAGILKGKKATYYENPASFKEMRIGKAVIVDTPVVREGRVITANGPSASKAFADEIVHALTAVEW